MVYWAVPDRWRLRVLALSSILFYAPAHLPGLPVLLAVVIAAWAGGLWMGWLSRTGRTNHRLGQVTLIAALLAPLVLFKYWDWVAANIEALFLLLGVNWTLPRFELTMPLGISFFTFQAIAYVIDVRRDGQTEPNLWRFGTFMVWFPQLIMGPILRRQDLLPQLRQLPLLSSDDVGEGLYRIGKGVVKVLLIAQTLKLGMVDTVFDDPSRFTSIEILVALYAFTLQIYCDFSGYMDIALGSARLFGMKLPENFRRPYKATSVADFWRRWHITLSNWVRDYIYFPLGGARAGSEFKAYRNIIITMLIIGIWHGASWNFVLYGLLHGSGVAFNRFLRKRNNREPASPLTGAWSLFWRIALTFHFLVLTRILFRAADLEISLEIFLGLLEPELLMPRYSLLSFATLGLGYLIHWSPDGWQDRARRIFVGSGPLGWALILSVVGALCMSLGSGEPFTFIYYQF